MHGKLQQVVRIYGIRNCDSMKKAFVWLAEHAVACDFVDYRQAAPTAAQLADWNLRVGWKALLNTRGTTWRRLGEEDRADVDEARALTLMAAIERGAGADDSVVRGWLTRALSAPRGPQWVCDKCQQVGHGLSLADPAQFQCVTLN